MSNPFHEAQLSGDQLTNSGIPAHCELQGVASVVNVEVTWAAVEANVKATGQAEKITATASQVGTGPTMCDSQAYAREAPACVSLTSVQDDYS